MGSDTVWMGIGDAEEEEEEEPEAEEEEGVGISAVFISVVLSSLMLNGGLKDTEEGGGGGVGGTAFAVTVVTSSTGVISILTEGTYNPAKSARRLFIKLFTAFITNNSIFSLFSLLIEEYKQFTVTSLTVGDFPFLAEDTEIERWFPGRM